jgi:hypothetical protein
VLRRRYCDSVRGVRREMLPVEDVMRIWCPGMVASAAVSREDGSEEGRRVADLVRGRRVIVVGRWPPREKVVLCNSR